MKKHLNLIISVLALIVAIIAISCSCCKKEQGTSVEELILAKPEIVVQAIEKHQANLKAEQEAQLQARIDANLEKLQNNPNSPVLGNQDGTVTIVEFFDYNCGYCKHMDTVVEKTLAKNADVKWVAKPLNFLSPTSAYAAKASISANLQGKYQEFHRAIMSNKSSLTEAKVDELAISVGMDVAKMKADIKSDNINQIIDDNVKLSREIGLNGVPVILVNGKLASRGLMSEDALQKAIDEAKTTNNNAEEVNVEVVDE